MSRFKTINFRKWLEENRHLLKPPVGNKVIWEDAEFIVMVIGGPNLRTDYHDDPGEEFFYQVEGDIVLKVVEDDKPIDLKISQGEIFLLPAHVPHSPRRPANTIGVVVERKRHVHEKDGFMWFCENCGHKLYEEYLYITNIVTQLPPIFDRFYGNENNCCCKKCGSKMTRNNEKN